MSFLGRKVHGNFQGDVVTDQLDFGQMPKRLPGRRVKHRMKRNWMKLYNKEGVVLRVETVINDREEFRIRRRVRRHGRWPHGAPLQSGGSPGTQALRGAPERRVCAARLYQPRAA
jgi:hypothetical protein